MSKSPAFRLYASDFYMDTHTWTNEEVGAYFRLLLFQWVNGSIPEDQKKIQKILQISSHKFQKIWSEISHKFVKNLQGEWQNMRLEEEREKQFNYRERLSNAGKKGMENRWGKEEKKPNLVIT